MDIFVSWAGRDSHAMALVLRRWLPEVLPSVRPWVSSEDIRKGTRWSDELWDRLQSTSYCIVCLTPGAVRSPWVNFEAGAVARAVGGQAHVSPLLLGMSPKDLGAVPLAMFQCTEFTPHDMERLVTAINAVAATPVPESRVRLLLHRAWPILREEIGRIDIDSTGDSQEDEALKGEAVNHPLQPIQDRILEYVAATGDDWPLDVTDIAREVSENQVATNHYVDELVSNGFLDEQRSAEDPKTYLVTRRGRAYLVARGLV